MLGSLDGTPFTGTSTLPIRKPDNLPILAPVQDEKASLSQDQAPEPVTREEKKNIPPPLEVKEEKKTKKKAKRGAMTVEILSKICTDRPDHYDTPSLNTKLIANMHGFNEIKNLDMFSGLKVLYLENNNLTRMEGLECLPELVCLYLGNNCISQIEGLENCTKLATLSIPGNDLTTIENIQHLPNLSSLDVKSNAITNVQELEHCQKLSMVNLSLNKIPDDQVESIQNMPNLKCLYLKGNPCIPSIKNYRRVMISSIPSLNFLDDRPVEDLERLLFDAWKIGGPEAEKKARAQYFKEKQEKEDRNMKAWAAMKRQRAIDAGYVIEDYRVDEQSDEDGAEAKTTDDDDQDSVAVSPSSSSNPTYITPATVEYHSWSTAPSRKESNQDGSKATKPLIEVVGRHDNDTDNNDDAYDGKTFSSLPSNKPRPVKGKRLPDSYLVDPVRSPWQVESNAHFDTGFAPADSSFSKEGKYDNVGEQDKENHPIWNGWDSAQDRKLVELCTDHIFDFNAVAKDLNIWIAANYTAGSIEHLSAKTCRNRYADLEYTSDSGDDIVKGNRKQDVASSSTPTETKRSSMSSTTNSGKMLNNSRTTQVANAIPLNDSTSQNIQVTGNGEDYLYGCD